MLENAKNVNPDEIDLDDSDSDDEKVEGKKIFVLILI